MNRKEALKILSFSPSDNPSEYEIRKAYRKLALEYHPDKHSSASEGVKKQNEEKFKELGVAYNLFTGKDTEEVTKLTDENLDEINSPEDLKFYLYTALLKQDIAFLKKLFSKFKSNKDGKFGDYVNEMYLESYSPLSIALSNARDLEDFRLLNLLLTNGANPDIKIFREYTSLHFIGILERSEIVELLLKHGANPDIKNKQSETPLIRASNRGYYETVEILLKYSASLSVQNKYGEVPLHKASSRGHYKIVELLLKRGAGKESECVNDALLAAVEYHEHGYEKEKTVELLLKYGANPNEKNYHMRFIECTPYFANNDIINCIKTLVLPYGSNDKVKKLMAEYGGVDRRYLRDQTILACSCLIATGLSILYVASPWCYVPTAVFALAACFFIKNAVHAAFFAKTKEPSPEFAEVITEKVVNNVGLNAEDNSQETGNALA
ncbi:ankyrin repeat domain-containing protein [Wolbachia endosymbiont (group A) of Colletes cunicularius]|uniref:ankyrin repeat domain-containing protein n=1 Tax=Wolbachia endosymbiont (group A) of Colletes cunicularius TaxID=3139321 RepID=UPI0035C91651